MKIEDASIKDTLDKVIVNINKHLTDIKTNIKTNLASSVHNEMQKLSSIFLEELYTSHLRDKLNKIAVFDKDFVEKEILHTKNSCRMVFYQHMFNKMHSMYPDINISLDDFYRVSSFMNCAELMKELVMESLYELFDVDIKPGN